jgi:hypothetical protein
MYILIILIIRVCVTITGSNQVEKIKNYTVQK